MMAANESTDKDYLSVLGYEPFAQAVTTMLLGPVSVAIKELRATSVHCLGGNGAMRLAAEFLVRVAKRTTFSISDPAWSESFTKNQIIIIFYLKNCQTVNHENIFRSAGFESCRTYRYWSPDRKALAFDEMLQDLGNLPEKAVVVLQGCAHNPTGLDPSHEQWKSIADVVEVYL